MKYKALHLHQINNSKHYGNMKRYDLSQIMKRAHNFKKSGKYTMSEALKKSWKMAKFTAWMNEQSAIIDEEKRIKAEAKAQSLAKARKESAKAEAERAIWRAKQEAQKEAEQASEERAAKAMGMSFGEYQNFLSRSMGYGIGTYCGD